MWNKTTYPFLVQALCIIPLKSIRMWASFAIFALRVETGCASAQPNKFVSALALYYFCNHRKRSHR